MKRYISNGMDIYYRITDETSDYYICNNILILKSDVVDEPHPLDELPAGQLYTHTVGFVNY